MLSIFIIGVIWFINFWSCWSLSFSFGTQFSPNEPVSFANDILYRSKTNDWVKITPSFSCNIDFMWPSICDYVSNWLSLNSLNFAFILDNHAIYAPFDPSWNFWTITSWSCQWLTWRVESFYAWSNYTFSKLYLRNLFWSNIYLDWFISCDVTFSWSWDDLEIYVWNQTLDLLTIFNTWYCTSNNLCPDCPICDDPYTSLECQNEYNLIPIENVTKEYCEINHNLISPESCPICEWSGSINWSALYINNEQVSSASRINVNIDDWIDYNLNYVEDSATINVTGPEWDQEYIQWIIDTNSYQPSTEDFKNVFVWWLTLILPYLVVVLFVVFIWKFIRKIFK